MVKDVVFAVDAFETAMVVAIAVDRLFVPVEKHITVGNKRAAEEVAPIRPVTDRIAKLMQYDRGIDKLVFTLNLSNGTGLKKLMAFKSGFL